MQFSSIVKYIYAYTYVPFPLYTYIRNFEKWRCFLRSGSEEMKNKRPGENMETMLRRGGWINEREGERFARGTGRNGAALHRAIHPWSYFVYTLIYPSPAWLIFDEEIPSIPAYSHRHARWLCKIFSMLLKVSYRVTVITTWLFRANRLSGRYYIIMK